MSRDVSPERRVRCPHCGNWTTVVNGLWLREKRKRAGLSLREMARRLDLSAAYVSDIERNNRGASQDVQIAYDRLG